MNYSKLDPAFGSIRYTNSPLRATKAIILVDTTTRQDNSWKRLQCPISHCSSGHMIALCSQTHQCRSRGEPLPSRWFTIGAVGYSTDLATRQSVTNYYHHTNIHMDCLPCCIIKSNHPKIPSKSFMTIVQILNILACEQVYSVGNLCRWYADNGACPNFR